MVNLLGQSAGGTGARVTASGDQTLTSANFAVSFDTESSSSGDVALTGEYSQHHDEQDAADRPRAASTPSAAASTATGPTAPITTRWGPSGKFTSAVTGPTSWSGATGSSRRRSAGQHAYLNVTTACALPQAGDYIELIISKPAGFSSKVLADPPATIPTFSPVFWILKLG